MLAPPEREISLFGGRTRTAILIAVRLLEETYATELADMLGLRKFSVQRVLDSLESEGAIVSRTMGRTRLVQLNTRYFAAKPLAELLWSMGKKDTGLQKQLATRRRRPRRAGKPGL
jgi:DNA-binding transcriptional ArsR family regulator